MPPFLTNDHLQAYSSPDVQGSNYLLNTTHTMFVLAPRTMPSTLAIFGAMALVIVLAAQPTQASYSRLLLQTNATDFPPNCKCERDSFSSPFRLAFKSPSILSSGLFQYCYTLTRDSCNVTQPCCTTTQNVNKVEFQVGELRTTGWELR